MWSENEVEFMSTLYLPRNSPVYWPIQVSDEKNYMYFKILVNNPLKFETQNV